MKAHEINIGHVYKASDRQGGSLVLVIEKVEQPLYGKAETETWIATDQDELVHPSSLERLATDAEIEASEGEFIETLRTFDFSNFDKVVA